MRKRSTVIIIITIILSSVCFISCNDKLPKSYETDLRKYYGDFQGCFVLYDFNNRYYIRYNNEQASKRLSPCSTFKIPNSLIGLETEVITDENFMLKWDSTKYYIDSWNMDHTLKTAISNSVVWYYQEIARRVGEERMKAYINKIGYGNNDISGGIDKFWLMNSLKISANEQVEFLKKLYTDSLPFAKRNIDIVKNIIILEKNSKYTFSGKTGSGTSENRSQGWFIGTVLLGDNLYVFAVNIEAEKGADGKKAKEIAIEILKNLKIL